MVKIKKNLRKSEWVLIASGPATGVTAIWTLASDGGIPFAAFILCFAVSMVVSLWHAIDGDVEIKD